MFLAELNGLLLWGVILQGILSSTCWHDNLFDILQQMDFKPSQADPDIWMKLSKDGTQYCWGITRGCKSGRERFARSRIRKLYEGDSCPSTAQSWWREHQRTPRQKPILQGKARCMRWTLGGLKTTWRVKDTHVIRPNRPNRIQPWDPIPETKGLTLYG